MDYNGLSKVVDSFSKKKIQTAGDLEVSERRNPLDKLLRNEKCRRETRNRVIDSKKLEGVKKPVKKLVKKVSDPSKKLAYVYLDNVITNYIFEPTDYNKDILQETFEDNKESLPEDMVRIIYSLIEDPYYFESNTEDLDTFLSNLEDEGLNPQIGDALYLMSEDSELQDESDAEPLEEEEPTDEEIEEFVEDSIYQKYGVHLKDLLNNRVIDATLRDTLDKIEEGPYIDPSNGETEEEFEDKSILDVLNEALVAYAHGDSSKLDSISKQTVEVPVDSEPNKDEEGDENNEPEEGEEEESDDMDRENEIRDSIELAKSILVKNPNNQIIDSLRYKVPALRMYNFRKTDSEFMTTPFNEEVVPNPPMTRDEYYSLNSEYPCMEPLISELGTSMCPNVETWELQDPYLVVNGCQKYVPYKCSFEELENQINECPEGAQRILSSVCCSVEDYLRAAVLSNNLNIVDNKFYKKHMNDNAWSFDEKPDILKDIDGEFSSIKMKSIDDSDGKEIKLFGVSFILN